MKEGSRRTPFTALVPRSAQHELHHMLLRACDVALPHGKLHPVQNSFALIFTQRVSLKGLAQADQEIQDSVRLGDIASLEVMALILIGDGRPTDCVLAAPYS